MAFTVTATATGAEANGCNLRILVLTGAAAASSQTATGVTSVSAYHASVTTTTTGSRVVGTIVADGKADLVALARPALDDPNFAIHAVAQLTGQRDYAFAPTPAKSGLDRLAQGLRHMK